MGAHEADIHLLSRHSSDSTLSAESLSVDDYMYGANDQYHKPRMTGPRILGRLAPVIYFLYSLSHRPLGWRKRRKGVSRVSPLGRLLICVYNAVIILLALFAVRTVLGGIFFPSYWSLPAHYVEFERRLHDGPSRGKGNPFGEKIFIASNIIQPDKIRGAWGQSLLKLVDYLGPENVFVSIYENDSGPEPPKALAWLRSQLPCEHSIVYGDHIPLTDFPRIVMPTGETALKRLTYLTEVRNRMMRPLDEPPPTDSSASSAMRANYTDTRFDRILFLNDIYFRPEDALHILFNTNRNPSTQRAEYSVACALDFSKYFWLYDTFVIRDTDGYEIASLVYPWFHTAGTALSRADVLAQRDAVRVRSCWSGLAAFDAAPFLRTTAPPPPPPHGQAPLRFRHEPELFWEASECCLLNADMALRAYGGSGVRARNGVYVNPYVRVAYTRSTRFWQRVVQRFERAFAPAQHFLASHGWVAPEENPRRADVGGREAVHRKWTYAARPELDGERRRAVGFVEGNVGGGEWRDVKEEAAQGGFCGQRRLFVLMKDLVGANSDGTDKNWKKMPVPPDNGS